MLFVVLVVSIEALLLEQGTYFWAALFKEAFNEKAPRTAAKLTKSPLYISLIFPVLIKIKKIKKSNVSCVSILGKRLFK